MKNASELLQLGKQLSSTYLQDGTDLTESLTKTAVDNSLTKEEINRVAETANIETYLGLVNKTPDHYVQFDLADSRLSFEKAAALTGIPVTSEDGANYADLDNSAGFSFSLYKTKSSGDEVVTKLANVTIGPSIQSIGWRNKVDFMKDELLVKKAGLSTLVDKVNGMIKQAVLKGVIFNNVVDMIKMATPSLSDFFITSFKEDFSKECPFIDLEKTADLTLMPSTSSDLFQKLASLDVMYMEFASASQNLDNEYVALNKFILENELGPQIKIAGAITEVAGFVKKYPVITTTAVVAPTAYIAGKKNKEPGTNYLNKNNAQQAILAKTR